MPRLRGRYCGNLGRPLHLQADQLPLIGQWSSNRARTSAGIRKRLNEKSIGGSTTAPVALLRSRFDRSNSYTLPSSDEQFAENGQDRKLLFVNAELIGGLPLHLNRLCAQCHRLSCRREVIIAVLLLAIRSDLPGQIAAEVTEPVFDFPFLAVLRSNAAEGGRLIGNDDSQVALDNRARRPRECGVNHAERSLNRWNGNRARMVGGIALEGPRR